MYLFNLDIKDFFKSISKKQINEFFNFLGVPKSISKIFAKITTVKDHLVEGFNTSPTLANFVFRKIDITLNKIASKNSLIYTRYADDLTFSGNKPINIISEVEKILNASNFTINQDKIRYFKRGGPMYVTGLTVCDDKLSRVTKKYKNRIRMTLFNLNKKIENASNEEDLEFIKLEIGSLKGKINFINGIERFRANKYICELNKIEDNLETKEKEIFKQIYI
ncbi:MAG: hypothetical protein UR23_C0028G0004 [Candidatus Roizmanbacteria bacterium GW2011_GWA2_32_13]|uniref:Reverse transcriptase domain-containing protein n=1 Tax=Candidatus Roizmanbacteria bacterium GW2011_GWA2_32_13 TaxID=1618475 RepID=A0A0F9Z9D4_9BACT|nr:MAG: hypothetical protein UR23_C0028G0004 [Candidatus Roizmanbacteria bacterium GW2011_GWA2_32_13]